MDSMLVREHQTVELYQVFSVHFVNGLNKDSLYRVEKSLDPRTLYSLYICCFIIVIFLYPDVNNYELSEDIEYFFGKIELILFVFIRFLFTGDYKARSVVAY